MGDGAVGDDGQGPRAWQKGVKGNWAFALSASHEHARQRRRPDAGVAGRTPEKRAARTPVSPLKDSNLRALLSKAVEAERALVGRSRRPRGC